MATGGLFSRPAAARLLGLALLTGTLTTGCGGPGDTNATGQASGTGAAAGTADAKRTADTNRTAGANRTGEADRTGEAAGTGDAGGTSGASGTPSPSPTPPEDLCTRIVTYWAREVLDSPTYGDYQSMGLSNGQYEILRTVVNAARTEKKRQGADAAAELIDREARTGCADWYRSGGPGKGPWQ
ncbi:hypothetical protein ACWCQK_12870 [Streptomyces sp. NPDC002306]